MSPETIYGDDETSPKWKPEIRRLELGRAPARADFTTKHAAPRQPLVTLRPVRVVIGGMSSFGPGTGDEAVRNPYAAPADDAHDRERQARGPNSELAFAEFYIVSQRKFLLLACTTFSLYTVYWFFAQFRRQRRHGMKTSPFFAALFSLFTAYRLFKRVDHQAQIAGLPHTPRATSQTAPYICLVLLGNVLLRFDNPALKGAGFAAITLSTLPLSRVQNIANRVAGDPEGDYNSKLTALNIAAISLGGILWLLILIGLFALPTAHR